MEFQQVYNLDNIDNLLNRFSVEELLRLTFQSEFQELRDQLPEDTEKKSTLVRRIIEFAGKNELFRNLLRWAKEKKPRVYERFGPYQQGVLPRREGPDTSGTRSIETTATAMETTGALSEFEYDVFICHATEDKDDLVDPLAEMLQEIGVRVWYDKFTLEWGDSLSQKIDKGLARSRYGIVVLSKSFFHKDWTQYELQGLWNREIGGHKVILPIWHKVTKDEIVSFAPTLANKMALNTSKHDLEEIVRETVKMIKPDP